MEQAGKVHDKRLLPGWPSAYELELAIELRAEGYDPRPALYRPSAYELEQAIEQRAEGS